MPGKNFFLMVYIFGTGRLNIKELVTRYLMRSSIDVEAGKDRYYFIYIKLNKY